MALAKFYFAGKHANQSRSRISFMYIDDQISGVNLSALLAAFEVMSNNNVSEDADHPRVKIYGASHSIVDVQAADKIIEGNDLTRNPFGIDGYAFGDDSDLPAGLDIRQPVTLKGLNFEYTLPAGYDGGSLENVAKEFVEKWAKVRYLEGGVLKGKDVINFNITSVYEMN